ncbi:MAG: Rsd/AlgQ family anti-sigma factor [Gammaproteobacteria bacterium]|nr:Rsd/AlgQ family anti-sigma factor [Gammaproteobacteria bacterium]
MTQKAEDKTEADRRDDERRRGSQDSITKMVEERAQVLSLYCRLAGLEPYADGKHRPDQKMLQEFCQILVDYIAAGHFGLYERIINGTERRREVSTLAQELYPRIADTTSLALDFNDKYDCGDHCDFSEAFQADLSRLGEELAVRIDLEDKLIARLVS